jgi:putative Holliday junction resolvase
LNAATTERPAAATIATVLAFDFGTRRIGIAVGNTMMRTAHPLTTIDDDANAVRFAAIDALVAEWAPAAFVVGRPLADDGADIEMTARAERFARQLESRYRVPVARVDERYTSRAASSVLVAAGVRGRARVAVEDQVAAQLILQSWFDDEARASL